MFLSEECFVGEGTRYFECKSVAYLHQRAGARSGDGGRRIRRKGRKEEQQGSPIGGGRGENGA